MEFADQGTGGLVLKLSRAHHTDQLFPVMKFEAEIFSAFPEERECLFFGGKTNLRINGIMQWADGKWRHYDKFMVPLDAFNRMIHGMTLSDYFSKANVKLQRMNQLIDCLLVDLLSEPDQHVIPSYVKSLVLYQIESTPHIRFGRDAMFNCDWLDWLFRKSDVNSPNNVDIVSICVAFCNAESITFPLQRKRRFETEWESLIDDMGLMTELGLSMRMCFEISSNRDQQEDTYGMVIAGLDYKQSAWNCRHERNLLIFETENQDDIDLQSPHIRGRVELLRNRLAQRNK